MLKCYSVNLSQNHLLHLVTSKNFSLFTSALMFFNHKESLVKTASRTVVLSILKCKFYLVQNDYVNEYVIESGFFYNISNSLRDSLACLGKSIKLEYPKLEEQVYNMMDTIYYVEDIIQVNNPGFNEKIRIYLIRVVWLPVICGSIINVKGMMNHHIPISVALYFSCQMLLTIKEASIQDFITNIFCSAKVPKKLIESMKLPLCSAQDVAEDPSDMEENIVLLNLKLFLNCKDDALVALSASLIHSALLFSSHDLLQKIGLLPGAKNEIYMRWVGEIGEILNTDNNFRFFTCLAATRCLSTMLSAEVALSYTLISQIFKNLTLKLSESILHYSAGKSVPLNFSKIIKASWDFVQKIIINDKINIPIQLLNPALEDKNFPIEVQKPLNEIDNIVHQIRCFWLYRRIFAFVKGLENESSFPISDSNLTELQKGMQIKISDRFFNNKPKIIVKVKDNGSFVSKVLVRDENFLILLARCQYSDEFYKIDIFENLAQIILPENESSKVFTFKINEDLRVSLYFEDTMEWLSIKHFYEKHGRNAKTFQMIEIQNFLRDQKRILESFEDI